MKRSFVVAVSALLVFAWLILQVLLVIPVQAAEVLATGESSPRTVPKVLNVEEVASLLRVNSKDVIQLARTHRIPGRLIGGQWRFSRTAVLDWLGQVASTSTRTQPSRPHRRSHTLQKRVTPRNGTARHRASESAPHKNRLSETALTDITGKGPGDPTTSRSSSTTTTDKEPETIGEKKSAPTAEEVSLRGQQVLLNPQQLTLELDFSFTRSEQTGLTVVPIGPNTFLGNSTGEQDLYITSFTTRYGLPYDFLLVASLPLIHDRQSTFATVPGTNIINETSDSLTETGDFFLGARHTTIKEGVGYPEVIFSVNTLIPTRQSSFGLGGGVALIKRIDPVALFANFDYVHVFSREFEDVSRLRSDNIFNINFGYAFSMNENLALSTSVLGTFTTRTAFDNPNLPSLRAVERFFLRASLTALLTEKLFVEPFVTFALNGSNIVTLGVNLPYTFDVAPYMDKMFN